MVYDVFCGTHSGRIMRTYITLCLCCCCCCRVFFRCFCRCYFFVLFQFHFLWLLVFFSLLFRQCKSDNGSRTRECDREKWTMRMPKMELETGIESATINNSNRNDEKVDELWKNWNKFSSACVRANVTHKTLFLVLVITIRSPKYIFVNQAIAFSPPIFFLFDEIAKKTFPFAENLIKLTS